MTSSILIRFSLAGGAEVKRYDSALEATLDPSVQEEIQSSLELVQTVIGQANEERGWWTDLKTGQSKYITSETNRAVFYEKSALIASELGEMIEGFRKSRADDHLPHLPSAGVELADVVIRCFDLAHGMGYHLGHLVSAKLQYNSTRPDHNLAARQSVGGKQE